MERQRNINQWDSDRIEAAKNLLIRATNYQSALLNTSLASEIIKRSTPVLWFGDIVQTNWVTIATNPSAREFLDRENQLLLGKTARFFVRDKNVSLEKYVEDSTQLEATIEYYRLYFKRNTTYRSWFGKKNGGKLEGFLNGMGGSLYDSVQYRRVVHTDFCPISTKSQMGRIVGKKELLDSHFAKELLRDTLEFIKPSLIIVLGREHCPRFACIEEGFFFSSEKSIRTFPDAKYQIGFYKKLNIPVLGLHFKPSEQFIGLGGGTDRNGKSHGEYATSSCLKLFGEEVMRNLHKHFPNYIF